MTAMQAAAAANRFTGPTGPIGTTNVVGGQEGGTVTQQTQPPAPSPVQPQSAASTGAQSGAPQGGGQGQMPVSTPTGTLTYIYSHGFCKLYKSVFFSFVLL